MTGLQIDDVFEPYYVGRKPFLTPMRNETAEDERASRDRGPFGRRASPDAAPPEAKDAKATGH